VLPRLRCSVPAEAAVSCPSASRAQSHGGRPMACRHHGLTGSMGRVGTCADNAAMESFFSLQKNVLDRQQWLTR
jgi:transposase InsO family protein